MKPSAVAGVCLMCLLMVPDLNAEESSLKVVRIRPNLDTDKLQYILSTERKEVFERNMNLDEQQSEVFWGVYHRYEKEKDSLKRSVCACWGPISRNSPLSPTMM